PGFWACTSRNLEAVSEQSLSQPFMRRWSAIFVVVAASSFLRPARGFHAAYSLKPALTYHRVTTCASIVTTYSKSATHLQTFFHLRHAIWRPASTEHYRYSSCKSAPRSPTAAPPAHQSPSRNISA